MKTTLLVLAGALALVSGPRAARAACGIAVTDDSVTPGCLPALSTDRSTVGVPVVDPDGGRGNPNLTVKYLPVAGGDGPQMPILTVQEWDTLSPADRAKRAAPRAQTVDLQLGRGLVSMKKIVEGGSSGERVDFKLDAGGYTFTGKKATVTIARGGATLATVKPPASPAKGQCRGANWPWLQAVYVEGDVAALQFAFHGNDTCWEPAPAWVVTRLTGGGSAGAATGSDPAAAAAANDRGMKRYRAKDWAGATAEFKAALAADAAHVKAHYNLACVSALAGDKATALAELRWLADSKDPAAKEKLQKAATDSDLASLRSDPEAKRLLGLDGGDAAPAGSAEKLWTEESFGPLKIGMSPQAVTAALGKPTQKSPLQKSEATGDWVSGWDYDGISLTFGAQSKKGALKLQAISLKAPATLACRGVTIGSSLAELTRAFPKSLWNEESSNDEHVTVGSPYGGIIFTIEKRRVSEIFVGAAAE